MSSPDRNRSIRGSSISNNHKPINLQQQHRLSIWAPYHDTTSIQKEWHTLKGRYPLITLPHPSCFDHFRGVRSDEVSSTKPRFIQKLFFRSTNDQSNDHKDKWSNKWSYHKWSNNDHLTATLSMPHYQIGSISLITFNYITSELVRLREGC